MDVKTRLARAGKIDKAETHGTEILERAENIDGLHGVIRTVLALRIADGWVRDVRPQLVQRDVLGPADEQALVARQRRLSNPEPVAIALRASLSRGDARIR